MPRVVIVGGGVAGMSAAHLLIRQNFEVTVYEYRAEPGGKARSMTAFNRQGQSNVPAVGPLPGEHGFRFFPGFYHYLLETMGEIGRPGGGHASDNLVDIEQLLLARVRGRDDIHIPAHIPTGVEGVFAKILIAFELMRGFHIWVWEMWHFRDVLNELESASEERKYNQIENASWWDYCGAGQRSQGYQKFIANGLTRIMVAAGGREISARSAGYSLLALLGEMSKPKGRFASVLNGPTNEVWLDPWLEQLRHEGVDFQLSRRIHTVEQNSERVTGLVGNEVEWHDGEPHDKAQFDADPADAYILAVPVEVLQNTTQNVAQAGGPLGNRIDLGGFKLRNPFARLDHLKTAWMNGIQFYMRNDVPIIKGHVGFVDSAWALTLVSQAQFWATKPEARTGGKVSGILSVDVSNWFQTDSRTGKEASQCDAQEIASTVWAQLENGLNNDPANPLLSNANCVGWFLDPSIVISDLGGHTVNCEPYLMNTPGSWDHRPKAKVPGIANLYLAADYVKTTTDIPTMESANEAARRAVAAIVNDLAGGPPPPPTPPEEPPEEPAEPGGEPDPYQWARVLDRIRFEDNPDAPVLPPIIFEDDEAVANEEFFKELQARIDPAPSEETVFGPNGLELRVRVSPELEE